MAYTVVLVQFLPVFPQVGIFAMRHMMQRGVYGLGGFLKASKARLELKMFKL